MGTPDNRDLSVGQLTDHAAHAIRSLNHRTRHRDSIRDPAELCWLLANLATMTDRLPQLLDQLANWLRHEHADAPLRSDDNTDPGRLVCLTIAELTRASQCAQHLAHTIDNAHQHAAHLETS